MEEGNWELSGSLEILTLPRDGGGRRYSLCCNLWLQNERTRRDESGISNLDQGVTWEWDKQYCTKITYEWKSTSIGLFYDKGEKQYLKMNKSYYSKLSAWPLTLQSLPWKWQVFPICFSISKEIVLWFFFFQFVCIVD